MNTEKFWDEIESAKKESGNDLDKMHEFLVDSLATLEISEIIVWHHIFWEYQNLSNKNKLWAAAYIINGGCSDDAFDYFRSWLIAQGRDVLLAALKAPDSLALCFNATLIEQLLEEEDVAEFEYMLSVALDAYLEKIGVDETEGSEKIIEEEYDKFYKLLEEYPLKDDEKTKILSEIVFDKDIDIEWEDDDLPDLLPNLYAMFFNGND